jgi:hypothetical protein
MVYTHKNLIWVNAARYVGKYPDLDPQKITLPRLSIHDAQEKARFSIEDGAEGKKRRAG